MSARWVPLIGCLGVCLLVSGGVSSQEIEEEAKITESVPEFFEGSDAIIADLEKSDLQENLSTSGFGSMPSGEFTSLVATIRRESPIQGIGIGATTVTYDVIVQPGHYGRTSGAVGTSGALVSERALVAHIARTVAEGLRDSGLNVLLVPADGVPIGMNAKVFLAIHADGSEKACKIGPSLAYGGRTSPHAMHAIGFALSRAFGYDYADFMKDNYTVAESKYYMFAKVNTTIMKGLLEVGELTCPDIERRLIESSPVIGANVAAGLKYIAETQAAKP